MTHLPLVSIGMPTYNRADRFERALKSAMGQTYGNLEIVISDNCSSDGTAAVCTSASADPRVRVLRQVQNIGAEPNFQVVLKAAKGELFMWLADDDWLEDNYIAECVGFLLGHPDYALVAGQTVFYGVAGSAPFLGSSTTLDQDNPEDRVYTFYNEVREAAVFYGVARRELTLSLRMDHIIGSDWHMVGAYAAAGKIATLETARMHRSSEGISKSSESLIALYGLEGADAENLHAVIARGSVTQILWHMKTYRAMSTWRRLKLGLRVYLTMYERWILRPDRPPTLGARVTRRLHWWALKVARRA